MNKLLEMQSQNQ